MDKKGLKKMFNRPNMCALIISDTFRPSFLLLWTFTQDWLTVALFQFLSYDHKTIIFHCTSLLAPLGPRPKSKSQGKALRPNWNTPLATQCWQHHKPFLFYFICIQQDISWIKEMLTAPDVQIISFSSHMFNWKLTC